MTIAPVMRWIRTGSLLAAVLLIGLPTHAVAVEATGLTSIDLFALAGEASNAGRIDDAVTIYEALEKDPDVDIRSEARFRKGMMLADRRRYAAAAVAFRALLDERPDAAAVRLELARILALMGREIEARREVRQAQATGLPPDVLAVVDQFARALRSSQRFGGSIEFAIMPDSNINRATNVRTLDTVIAPLTLSREARAKSGLGAKVGGQGFARVRLGEGIDLLPRLSGSGTLYRQTAFDDVSASALLGIEWRNKRDRISPSIGATQRWYGGDRYAGTLTAALDWLHVTGRRSQLALSTSAARARYTINPLQDGYIYDANISIERALSARSGAALTLSASRQSARDPGYATWAGGANISGWREIGGNTAFMNLGARRTIGDERLFLFADRRKDWLLQARAGVTLRKLSIEGFAPLVRIGYERNVSTVGIYDYRRLSTDLGIVRAF